MYNYEVSNISTRVVVYCYQFVAILEVEVEEDEKRREKKRNECEWRRMENKRKEINRGRRRFIANTTQQNQPNIYNNQDLFHITPYTYYCTYNYYIMCYIHTLIVHSSLTLY